MEKTYKRLSNVTNNKNFVVLSVDKETCTLILNRTDYQNNVNNMINEDILEGKYIEAVDNTHKDLKRFQDFLYRNLNKLEQYENNCQKSNQHCRFFAATKTYKFDLVNGIILDQLKFCPIIDQTGTYVYNASIVVSKYLRIVSQNKYSIEDTLKFPELFKMQRNQATMKMFHIQQRREYFAEYSS